MCESYWEMMFHRSMFMSRAHYLNGNADNDDMAIFYAHLIQACLDWYKKHEKTCDLCKVLVA